MRFIRWYHQLCELTHITANENYLMIGGALNTTLQVDYGCVPAFIRLSVRETEVTEKCDHKFVDFTSCLKCGWTPPQDKNKLTGRIIKISKAGWGFISSKEIEFTRIFFHWTSLQQDTLGFKELKTGMMVEFSPLQVEGKGIRAIHVRVIPRKKEEHTDEMPTLSEQRPNDDR